jgi:hypothetical protein
VVDDKKMEAALDYLARTDEEAAGLKANVARTEYLAKLKESGHFLQAEGNIEERKASAKVTTEVQSEWDEHFKAIAAYEKVRARRERASLVIDCWRTIQASRRAGMI